MTHYVTQTAAGTADGSSESNAWGAADFNSSGNWSSPTPASGKISPGDTVVLFGTITSDLTIQASGASGNPITILFASGAKMTSARWATQAILCYRLSFITIDGGTNGIIENTDNGSPSLDFGQNAGSVGVRIEDSFDVAVRNLTVRNLYVREVGGDQTAGIYGILIRCSNSSRSFARVLVEDCIVAHAEMGVYVRYEPGSETFGYCNDVIVRRCEIAYVNNGIRVGNTSGTGLIDNVVIRGNTIGDMSNWDDTSGANKFHHEHIYIFHQSSPDVALYNAKDILVDGNRCSGPFGSKATAGIVFVGAIVDGLVVNNVVTGPGSPANGYITVNLRGASNLGLYNNTVFGDSTAYGRSFYYNTSGGASNAVVDVRNNLCQRTQSHQDFNGLAPSLYIETFDRNLYYLVGSTGGFRHDGNRTWEQWQVLGFDANGIFDSDPLLTETYRLGAGSPAIGTGENLSAYFTTDADGNTRPASGAWDIGAFQYGEAPPPTPPAARGRKRRGAKLLSFFR
jgi:hypothetical protein